MRTFTYSLAFLLLFVDQVPTEAHSSLPHPVFEFFWRILNRIHNHINFVSLFFMSCRQLSVEDSLLESIYSFPRNIFIFLVYILLKKIFDNSRIIIRFHNSIQPVFPFVTTIIPHMIEERKILHSFKCSGNPLCF